VEIEDDDDSDDEEAERPCPLASLHKKLAGVEDDDMQARVLVAEVALRMLDWMGEHKSTWESAGDVWEMLTSILPKDSPLCVWSRVKNVLVQHLNGRMRTIELCPCGYTAYMNCTSDAFSAAKYQNAHRTQCPRPGCGLSRHLPGILPLVARKVTSFSFE
jgi:hypothetical protein